jgi:hypothetical protein
MANRLRSVFSFLPGPRLRVRELLNRLVACLFRAASVFLGVQVRVRVLAPVDAAQSGTSLSRGYVHLQGPRAECRISFNFNIKSCKDPPFSKHPFSFSPPFASYVHCPPCPPIGRPRYHLVFSGSQRRAHRNNPNRT